MVYEGKVREYNIPVPWGHIAGEDSQRYLVSENKLSLYYIIL